MMSAPRAVPSKLTGCRVLVVDDHEDSRVLLQLVFRRAGATVLSADSAAQALEVLQSERVDLMVSDYNMPDFDGLWLIGQLRALEPAQGRNTPALLLTAYGCPELTRRACKEGFHGCVDKPFEAKSLLADAERLVTASV